MGRIGTRALSEFCQRVGSSLQAGVDVRRIWDTEAKRGSARQCDVMEVMRRQIAAGESVAKAFAEVNSYFPPWSSRWSKLENGPAGWTRCFFA